MSAQLNIIIYSIDKENVYLLSIDNDNHIFPHILLNNDNIDSSNLDIAFYTNIIISKYTNIDPNWTNPKLVDIKLNYIDSQITTNIYYGLYIPYSTKTNGVWVPIDKNNLSNRIIQKILCLR